MIVFSIKTIIYTIYRKNRNHNFHKFIISSYLRPSIAPKTGVDPREADAKPPLRSRSLTKKTFGETFGEACAATVAGYVGPGFHTWPQPHRSRHGSKSASTYPVPCQKDVRRRDRGQRPTATVDPNTKQRRRRQSRHCSRVRRPRFPHVAPKPHPSKHGSESASSHPAPCQKDVR